MAEESTDGGGANDGDNNNVVVEGAVATASVVTMHGAEVTSRKKRIGMTVLILVRRLSPSYFTLFKDRRAHFPSTRRNDGWHRLQRVSGGRDCDCDGRGSPGSPAHVGAAPHVGEVVARRVPAAAGLRCM